MSPMKLTLGVLTAIGGFVDIGNLVTSGVTGARYGMALTWAIVLGTAAMCVYGEMGGRVAAVAKRATFQVVRERLGARTALLNLSAATLLSLLTLAAEIGGASLVLQLFTGVNYLVWVPVVGFGCWLVVWRLPFTIMENVFGLLGLTLIVFVVALFATSTDWGQMAQGITHPWVPKHDTRSSYWFYAISLIGAAVVPYQVVFLTSGGREERWTPQRMKEMRLNVFVGFPLGGVLSIAIMAAAFVVLLPEGVSVSHLGQVALPVAQALGPVGLIFALVGFLAATVAAGCETMLSVGYSVSQFMGWNWGKTVTPKADPRFHLVCLVAAVIATGFVLTSIDPIEVTIVSVVLGAAAIPLTYFPVMVVANDRDFMGRWVNGRATNAVSTIFLIVLVVTSLVTLPLLFYTKSGQ